MARRRVFDDPISRLAIWARRLALFALVAALLSIIIVRWGFLEVGPAVVTFGGALAFAMLAILLALGALIGIWRHGLGGLGHVFMAIFVGLVLIAYPAYFAVKAYRLPEIADITTDPIDPPRFEVIARLRPRPTNSFLGVNPVQYAGLAAAELQQKAYPDIETLSLEAAPGAVYEAALAVVGKRRWRIVDSREPLARRREGHIEAVARTPIMGFRDDIVIRIRANGEETLVDMRSASRYGRHDFGTNAARIRSLLDDIDDAVGTEQEKRERAEQKQKKQLPAKVQKVQPAKKTQAPAKR